METEMAIRWLEGLLIAPSLSAEVKGGGVSGPFSLTFAQPILITRSDVQRLIVLLARLGTPPSAPLTLPDEAPATTSSSTSAATTTTSAMATSASGTSSPHSGVSG